MIYAQLFHNGSVCDPTRSKTKIKHLFRNRAGIRRRNVSLNEGIDLLEADGWKMVPNADRRVGGDWFLVFAKEME